MVVLFGAFLFTMGRQCHGTCTYSPLARRDRQIRNHWRHSFASPRLDRRRHGAREVAAGQGIAAVGIPQGNPPYQHRLLARAKIVSSVWCPRRNDVALSQPFLHTLDHIAVVRRRTTWSIAWVRGLGNSSNHHHQTTTTMFRRHISLQDRRRIPVRVCMSFRLAILRLVLVEPANHELY